MKRPATASVVVFVAVILVAAVIAGILRFGTDGATAITVGDTKVSAESVNDELSQWADFRPAQARTTSGAVDSRIGASIATQIVWEQLVDEFLDGAGEGVTAADRATARDTVSGSSFSRLPKWFQDRYLDRVAAFAAFSRVKGDANDQNAELQVLRRLAAHTDITVDRAYGVWNPAKAQVVPWPSPGS
ncbi:MAG: hypothetical protein WDA60_03510 [Acidimicrobiia bacterium]|jgi:hypothetical protein